MTYIDGKKSFPWGQTFFGVICLLITIAHIAWSFVVTGSDNPSDDDLIIMWLNSILLGVMWFFAGQSLACDYGFWWRCRKISKERGR